jgi:hypothetical protein
MLPAMKFALLSAFIFMQNMGAAEIHHSLCVVVYGQNVMSEGTLRQ